MHCLFELKSWWVSEFGGTWKSVRGIGSVAIVDTIWQGERTSFYCNWNPMSLSANTSCLKDQYLLLLINKTRDENAQTKTYTQSHMKNVWSETVSCSPCFFILLVFFLFFGSYKWYGITFILLGRTLWPYSNLIISHASSITFLLTASNLMLYIPYSHFTNIQRLGMLLKFIISQPYIMRIKHCP